MMESVQAVRDAMVWITTCDARSAGAGICARRRTHFLCFAPDRRPKESKQRKATLLPVTPFGGNLLLRLLGGVCVNSAFGLKQHAALFRPKAAKAGTGRREMGQAFGADALGWDFVEEWEKYWGMAVLPFNFQRWYGHTG
jgi:hypothetical protein